MSKLHFDTLAIHAGARPDPVTKSRITPIHQTASFTFDNQEHASNLFALKEFGNIYSRIGNPTNAVLEERVATLEGGSGGLAVASGHAAEFLTLHTLLNSGDSFISSRKLYGGTISQFKDNYKKLGYHTIWVDSDDADSFDRAVQENTKAIFIESLSNPSGAVLDVEAIAKVAQKHNIPLIVDNTLATPYLLNPIKYGANIVIHSLTKFLGGHGNSIGGIIVDGGNYEWKKNNKFPTISQPLPEYNDIVLADTFDNIAFIIAARVHALRGIGPCLSPFNAFLILTGIETLGLRLLKHSENALTVAQHLENHPKVSWVNYPGLKTSPHYALKNKYLPKGAGAVLTFGVRGGYEDAVKFVSNIEVFSHLANIGDTRSLILHPASTSHSQLSKEQKIAAGSDDDVIRLSVGIEDAKDLIDALDKAFETL